MPEVTSDHQLYIDLCFSTGVCEQWRNWRFEPEGAKLG